MAVEPAPVSDRPADGPCHSPPSVRPERPVRREQEHRHLTACDSARSLADGHGTADDISRLADLRDRGVITEQEFQKAKAKALS
jgi:hypothetical protein